MTARDPRESLAGRVDDEPSHGAKSGVRRTLHFTCRRPLEGGLSPAFGLALKGDQKAMASLNIAPDRCNS